MMIDWDELADCSVCDGLGMAEDENESCRYCDGTGKIV